MPSPFPGMDPFLEAKGLWPDFHHTVAGEIRGILNETLPSQFYAQLEVRPEIGIGEEGQGSLIVPDISIVEAWPRTPPAGQIAVLDQPRTEISKSIEVKVVREPLRHHFIEIREAERDHKLITLIEIRSPSNKRRGPDREAYEQKQQEVLDSDANLIEIDFLRAGERIYGNLMIADLIFRLEPPPDYLVMVNRASLRGRREAAYQVFPIGLRDILPCIPVPLRGEYADVPLDLQYVVNRAYDRGPYRRGAVSYSQPPSPPFRESDIPWANDLLRQAQVLAP